MKQIILVGLLFASIAGLALGQGTRISAGKRWSPFPSYDPKTRPPLPLPEAYGIALARMGAATNQLYCVSASCLEMTNNGFTGWTFLFSNTNAQHTRVRVFFDKAVSLDNPSGGSVQGR
jgi:hypothetical protein